MSSQGAIYHGFSGTTHAEYTLDTLLDGLADSSVVEGRQDQNRIVHLADTKSSYVLGSPESMSGTIVATPVFTDTVLCGIDFIDRLLGKCSRVNGTSWSHFLCSRRTKY